MEYPFLTTNSQSVEATLKIAKGIHEYGVTVIVCSIFIILSGVLMITCFRWFKSIIESIMNNYSNQLQRLYEISNKNGEVLVDIAEGLISETILRVKTISEAIFEVHLHKCRDLVVRIKEENNIQNKEATKKKIHTLVKNQFDDIITKFSYFTFKGKPLSHYVKEEEWVSIVSKTVEGEVYQEVNPDRTYTNLKMVYDNIKLEFYQNLNHFKNKSL